MDDRKLMAAMAKALKNVTTLLKGTPFEVRASKLLEVVDIEEVERLAAEHEKTTEAGVSTRRSANMVDSSSSSSSAAVLNSSSSSSAAAPAVSSSSAARAPVPSGGASSFAGPSGSLSSSSSAAGPALSSSSALPVTAGPSGSSSSSSASSFKPGAPKKPFSFRGSTGRADTYTITKVNPPMIVHLAAQPSDTAKPQRKRPRKEVERKTRDGGDDESGEEEEAGEDPVEAIRAVIKEYFAQPREESPNEREARRQRRTSMQPPPVGVAEAAELFRQSARESYAGRYIAAMRARRLRNALRAEIDSKSKDPHAGMYWVAAGRKKRGCKPISLGHKYPKPGAEVEPVESRTLPMTHSEWRYIVTLIGKLEFFVGALKGGDTEENWEALQDLIERIPWESLAALAPPCGTGSVNSLNYLCTHTCPILLAALEQDRKKKSGKGKERADM